jgi:hypothetical protein
VRYGVSRGFTALVQAQQGVQVNRQEQPLFSKSAPAVRIVGSERPRFKTVPTLMRRSRGSVCSAADVASDRRDRRPKDLRRSDADGSSSALRVATCRIPSRMDSSEAFRPRCAQRRCATTCSALCKFQSHPPSSSLPHSPTSTAGGGDSDAD